ncbi:hypothetical protein DBR32_11935 [Taibaiella sp. KBW10]|uniref:hypothetical protein n=1 Tax=Taibaiella sp. KBW10 TaxID=2153357 RepID=UPI000F5A0C90|nr:hypothetical protein [Taibaiella sp. KBW10]RQO30277.1 hypothetical protein DBR32_11935 [Taibaiella sp. KBW10]
MAENATDHLTAYYAQIPVAHKEGLGSIRHWQQLRVAQEGDLLWIKGFTKEQIQSKEFKWIPFLQAYECRANLLFRIGHLVPERRLPASLLWNPVERLLNVTFNNWNHNYFGIGEQVPVSIIPSEKETDAFALLCNTVVAAPYIFESLKVRLDRIQWLMLEERALFLGTPVLSIPGDTFWKQGRHLIPTGYDFVYGILQEIIAKKIDAPGENWILWHTDSTYTLIPQSSVKPLSISSFRLSTI